MKHFRFILILLAVLLICSTAILASCDGDEESSTPDSTSEVIEPTAEPDETTASPETTASEADTTEEATKAPETTEEVTTEPPHTHSFGAWNTVKAATCTEEGTAERVCACGVKETQSVAKSSHMAGEWITDKESTETEEGSKHQACTVCGATLKTEAIPVIPHSHVWSEVVIVKYPTCTEEGLSEQSCACGEKKTFKENPIAHTESEWIEEKAATCTAAGSKYIECTVCKAKLKTESVPAKGHREGEWVIDKEATAKEEGSKHQPCAVCGATLKTESIPVTPHIPGEWVVVKEATCTEAGSKHRICTKCGEIANTEEIPAKGHIEVTDPAKASTCTETGLTAGSHCSVCDAVIIAQNIVPLKAHSEVVDPAKASTCTETGLTAGSHCSVCDAVITAQKIVPLKAHSETVDPAKAATCTESGLTAGSHCSVCGAVITAQTEVPAKGHTEKSVPAKAATCTETGLTEGKVCSVCNVTTKAQETVAAKGHTEETVSPCAPTCTATGLTEGKACKVCREVIVAQQVVPAAGHTEGEWIIDKEATLTSTGLKHQICYVCGETIKTETIPVVEPAKIDYAVTVLDGFGVPMSGVKVVFASNGKTVAEVTTDSSGKAVANLAEGEYEVVPEPASGNYASVSVKLTASAPAAEIILVGYATDPVYVYPDEKNGVYSVSVGSVRVPVEKGALRYFFFTPGEGAIYKIYTDTDKVSVGYYGASFFVTTNNSGEVDENGVLTLEVLKSSIGNTFVLGLESTSSAVTECTLTIVRYSDIGTAIEEIPYEMYEYQTPVPTETPKGNLRYVQIVKTLTGGGKEEIPVFFNENDGYYHLNSIDGPVLYVRINDKTIYQEALITIVSTSNLGRYIYDENGEFVRKERFNEAIIAYAEASDPKHGVYPLNDDLMYILKALADKGWYDATSPNSIFADDKAPVLEENGWLFACVYFS